MIRVPYSSMIEYVTPQTVILTSPSNIRGYLCFFDKITATLTQPSWLGACICVIGDGRHLYQILRDNRIKLRFSGRRGRGDITSNSRERLFTNVVRPCVYRIFGVCVCTIIRTRIERLYTHSRARTHSHALKFHTSRLEPSGANPTDFS